MPEAEEPGINALVHSDPETLDGTPVFIGTRVPVATLIEYLAAGDSLDEFLEDFPSVGRARAVEVLGVLRSDLSRRPAAD
jgi:uncharacterized protein (DUF433 family)